MCLSGRTSAGGHLERRLRSVLRHERQTVTMELAAALHHSCEAGRVAQSLTGTEDCELREETRRPEGARAAVGGRSPVVQGCVGSSPRSTVTGSRAGGRFHRAELPLGDGSQDTGAGGEDEEG